MLKKIHSSLDTYDTIINNAHQKVTPVLLLFLRLWVAWVFFNSGLLKLSSWDSTLYLFEFEYQVPLLPWIIAAYLGTIAELVLPIFIAFGLFTRPAAIALFALNGIAVVSYPVLWEGGFYDHQLWGLMILISIFWGAGSLSLDRILRSKIINSK